jgi:hypothetical protein
MSHKIENALDRLNRILPLQKQRQGLNPQSATLYEAILNSFIEKGRILTPAEIAVLVSNPPAVIQELTMKALIVCDSQHRPTGAYPFTMEQRAHRVIVNGHAVYAMCALDALAVSPMFNLPTEIHSQCGINKTPIHIIQHGFELQNQKEISNISFAINWNAASENTCCADSLCTEMIFINGEADAERWLMEDWKNREYRELFPLNEATEFAHGFFGQLLQ